jgi:hypothetical protein
MFAPEGYVRWSDLVEEIHEWSHKKQLALELEKVGKKSSRAFGGEVRAQAVRLKFVCDELNEL